MTRGLNRMLATGLVVFVAGIVRDGQWHATHDTQKQFENASRQVEVHWLLWLGAALLLVCGWVAARRSATATSRAPLAIFIGALAYGLLSVWHFIEHANGNDPQLAHLLLYADTAVMVTATLLALRSSGGALGSRRAPAQG